MRTITIFIDKETGNTTLKDGVVSFEPIDDYRVLHFLVIWDNYNNLANSLKLFCALHQDWCIDDLIERYGKEQFENRPNTDYKKYMWEQLNHLLGIIQDGHTIEEDIENLIEELED